MTAKPKQSSKQKPQGKPAKRSQKTSQKTSQKASQKTTGKAPAPPKMEVEMTFSGLCMLDRGACSFHFVDIEDHGGHQHHATVITFPAESWQGRDLGDVQVTPTPQGTLQVTLPLNGTVRVGSEDELDGRYVAPKILGSKACQKLSDAWPIRRHLLDLSDADFEPHQSYHLAKASCTVSPCGGQIFMRRMIPDANGKAASWKRWDGKKFRGGNANECFCDLVVWRTVIEEHEPRLVVRSAMYDDLELGGADQLRVSITNYPPLGSVGYLGDAFEHLHLFDRLVPGTARRPQLVSGTATGGSPSCPPAGGGG